MKKKYKNIDYDHLWSPTGDPFADAGGYALEYVSEHNPDMDILELIEFVTKIYVEKWDAKINAFFLNSSITQPSFKGNDKIVKTLEFYNGIINGIIEGVDGFCRIMGTKTKLYAAGRNNTVLTGSTAFSNFHHSFEDGLLLSKEALIRIHFLPLACEMLQGKICVIGCNNSQIAKLYATICCDKNFANIGQNVSTGILSSEYKCPDTAIFRFLDNVLVRMPQAENEYISLYHFTNFGASPELNVYTLPFMLFNFYKATRNNRYREDWDAFVAGYYRKPTEYKTAEYDETSQTFIVDDKSGSHSISNVEYKNWRNAIYQSLLASKSILPNILSWCGRGHLFSIELLRLYLINLLNMKKETISKIEQIADFILDPQNGLDMKKALTQLNSINSAFLLRRYILKIVEKNYAMGNEQPIVTVKDYTDYLFPETGSWKETRDVLVICIYQKLHEQNNHVNIEVTDDYKDDED